MIEQIHNTFSNIFNKKKAYTVETSHKCNLVPKVLDINENKSSSRKWK